MARIKNYEEEIVAVIQEHPNEIDCIQDIFEYYGGIKCSQFYNLKLEQSESIKKAIEANRCKVKAKMRKRWANADANPTLQLAAYKLMATAEERDALATTSKIDAKVDANAGLLVAFKDVEK